MALWNRRSVYYLLGNKTFIQVSGRNHCFESLVKVESVDYLLYLDTPINVHTNLDPRVRSSTSKKKGKKRKDEKQRGKEEDEIRDTQ